MDKAKSVIDDEILNLAKKRVNIKKDLFIHCGVYICVNVFLFLLNLVTYPEVLWVLWSISGWGIGLCIHVIVSYAELNLSIHSIMVEREYNKLKEKYPTRVNTDYKKEEGNYN